VIGYHSSVIWLQGLPLFILWIGYGALQSRRSAKIRAELLRLPRVRRLSRSIAFFILSVAALFGGFLAIDAVHGMDDGMLRFHGWVIAGVVGLIFVHLQMMAFALLVTFVDDSVTAPSAPASTTKDRPENLHEESSP
jgi:hypothetical protein